MRFTRYRVSNGSKLFGVVFWLNASRFAVDLHLGVWQFTIMKERS